MRGRTLWCVCVAVVALVGCSSPLRLGGPIAERTLTVDEPGSGGSVTFRFAVEQEVRVGDDRDFVRWTVRSSAREASPVWAAVAIEGLPSACRLEVRRWEEVEADVEAGRSPDGDQYYLTVDDGVLKSAKRSPVSDACTGDYRLHVAVGGEGEPHHYSEPIAIV